jgi:hypothetical protein
MREYANNFFGKSHFLYNKSFLSYIEESAAVTFFSKLSMSSNVK